MPGTLSDMKTGVETVNGASIYYEKKGSGPAVLLIHGFGLDGRMWDEQFDFLSRTFTVIRPDLRGFGRSSLPDDTPYSHAEDLYQLLIRLGISIVAPVGLSMGGRVAVDFVLSFPEQTSCLALVDAALNGYAFKTFSYDYINQIAKDQGIEKANLAWYHHELFDSVNKIEPATQAMSKMMEDYSDQLNLSNVLPHSW